jgi:hypothetical protein
MHDEVETAPRLLDLVEHAIDGGKIGHVAGRDDGRLDRFGQRNGTPPEGVALIGEGELRAMLGRGPRNAPGNGPIVRHSHHEAAFARQQLAGFEDILLRHERSQSGWKPRTGLCQPAASCAFQYTFAVWLHGARPYEKLRPRIGHPGNTRTPVGPMSFLVVR